MFGYESIVFAEEEDEAVEIVYVDVKGDPHGIVDAAAYQDIELADVENLGDEPQSNADMNEADYMDWKEVYGV